MYHLYLLQCGDDSIYTGVTNDLQRRFQKHLEGKGGNYTRSRGAKRIVYTEEYGTKGEALKREIEIKKWDRGRKLSLISKV